LKVHIQTECGFYIRAQLFNPADEQWRTSISRVADIERRQQELGDVPSFGDTVDVADDGACSQCDGSDHMLEAVYRRSHHGGDCLEAVGRVAV